MQEREEKAHERSRRSVVHHGCDQTVAFKMADGLCTEDTVGSNLIEKTLVKDYQSLVTRVQTDHSVNDDISTCTNVNSYYLDSDSGYEKYSTSDDSSSKGSDAKQHEGFFAMSSSPSDDDCRKKRCSDRYDSSESSDSGVAVLSCTDCSTYSGGSTASSDITDPGSPFSTESSQSEDSTSNQPPRMPPNLSAHHPPWPWSSGTESPPLKRATTTVIAANDKTATCPKRLKTEHSPHSTNTKDNNKTTLPIKDSNSNHVETANNKRKKVDSPNAKVQQGKITEYFKSQMKSNTIKNAIQVGLKNEVTNMQKYFTLIDGPKVILTGKKFSDFRKIDLRTVTVPVKKVVLDTKTKKISQVIAVPRKILPAPKPKNQSPIVKLTTLRYQHLTYISKKPPDMFKGAPGSNNIKPTLPVTKRLTTAGHPKMVPILNLKMSSTVVPIVKLSNMPSKLIGSNLNNNNNLLSVETAVPTVPTFKPKSPTLLEKSTKNELIKKFTSLDSNSNCSSSFSSGNITSTNSENSKSSLDSDSGVSIRDLLSVSVVSTPTCVEAQKSPILSQPKTIRFPAKQSESRKNQRRSDPGDSGLCRWSECQAQFDTSGALLEHLQIKHVISQATQEHYVCLWIGCKVHGRTSCSRSWLERHVLSHAGNKPFRCIVDGCGCRFSSQQTLERHVNSHFNGSENGSTNAKKSLESGQAKLFKRNGKKLRYRRQPWSARMFDFFDAGIMEGLQHRLVTMTEKRTLGEVTKSPGDSVTLQSRILARRTESDGSKKVLLRWYPPDVIPDEWALESDSHTTRTVSIPTLQPSALDALQETLFPPKTTTSESSNHVDQLQQQTATPHRPNRRKRIVVKSS